VRQILVTVSTLHISLLVVALLLCLVPFPSSSLRRAEASPPTAISPTDGTGSPASLGTIITSGTSILPTNLCSTSCVITGGTAAGHNLFHSFGDFNIGASDSARFQTGLVHPLPDASVSNILAQVTGGSSSLYGSLDSATYYPSANLFLMNPAGFLFGPNATVNVGGMVVFTSADYLRLGELGSSDAGIFHADSAQVSVLTSAPVVAFGFLGSIPGAITVQGSQFTVTEGAGISLVGGNITIQSGTLDDGTVQLAQLTASGRQINLASVASPGEILYPSLQTAPNINGQSFTGFGAISLTESAALDVSGNQAGAVTIRGGQLQISNATISANTGDVDGAPIGVDIKLNGTLSIANDLNPAITARTSGAGSAGKIRIESATLEATSNPEEADIPLALIDSHTFGSGKGGDVTITTGDLLASTGGAFFIDSGSAGPGDGGNVTISGTNVHLQDALIATGDLRFGQFTGLDVTGDAGNLSIKADSLKVETTLSTDALNGRGGNITLEGGNIQLTGNSFVGVFSQQGGSAITVTADRFAMDTFSVLENNTAAGQGGGTTITARVVELTNAGRILSSTVGDGNASDIRVTATDHVSLVDNPSVGSPSGLFSNSFGFEGNNGNSGSITVTTPRLDISGGARIDSSIRAIDNNTQTSGHGGDVTIMADSVSISGARLFEVPEVAFGLGGTRASGIYTRTVGSAFCSGPCGDAGRIAITTGSLNLTDGAQINSGTLNTGHGGEITINAAGPISISGTLNDGTPGGIFSRTIGTTAEAGAGGNIALTAGQSVAISDGASVSASSTGTGNAGDITVQGLASPAQSVLIDGSGTGVFTDTQGTGAGGNIFVNANTITLQNGGTLSAATSGTEVTATGGAITVEGNTLQLADSATISANTTGAGNAGEIFIQARDVSLSGFSLIRSDTTGDGQAGTVRVAAEESISLTESAIFSGTTSVSHTASGGQINVTAPIIDMTMAQLITLTTGPAPAGDITVATNVLNMKQDSEMNASTSGPGRSGDITIRGMMDGRKAQDVTVSGSSFVVSETLGDLGLAGNAGNLLVETAHLTVEEGGSLRSSSRLSSPGNAGTVTVNASESVRIMSGGGIESSSIEHSTGNAGGINITAPVVTVEGNSFLSTSTELTGNAGPITIRTSEFRLASGGQLTSSSVLSDETPTGDAGSVVVQGLARSAQSVLIDGAGSGIFTDTQGTGAGGNIFVNADSVTLQNGGKLSAATSGTDTTATGGTITVDAENTVTLNSASITAKSAGVADAGSINITSLNGFTMQNSTITTQAGQGAGGGNIKVTTSPSATVLLENSLINASVADGPGGGGNISIDPQFVILQNSQILAQAAQGQGGAITIIANLFLSDANSTVNADSGSGVNGTITIQSPNAPVSGQIQPLNKTPLLATSLLDQRCAALAGGQFSSFTVAGRDSLPTEPGSWLGSPLAFATLSEGSGLGTKAEGVKAEGMSASAGQVASGQWRAGEMPLLSLRQIAPAGFLTQAFAVEGSSSCQS
jgi:filamentous hemagglutinin family protein